MNRLGTESLSDCDDAPGAGASLGCTGWDRNPRPSPVINHWQRPELAGPGVKTSNHSSAARRQNKESLSINLAGSPDSLTAGCCNAGAAYHVTCYTHPGLSQYSRRYMQGATQRKLYLGHTDKKGSTRQQTVTILNVLHVEYNKSHSFCEILSLVKIHYLQLSWLVQSGDKGSD